MISSFRGYLETWYVRAFFLIMVATFVLWGVGDMLRVVGTSSWAAKVSGQTIEMQTLDNEYRRELAAAARNLPSGQEASMEMRRETANQSLQTLISQAAMARELRDMRIVEPDSALVDATRKLPAFKAADGTFDKARFEAVLRSNGLTEAGFLQQMRSDLARQQLIDAVTAGGHASDAETGPIYAAQFEKRSADMAAFPLAAIPEPAVPDEPTARRWYDNHPDLYATPEYRRVKIALLSPRTVAPEIAVTDKDLHDAYEQHLQEFTTIARRSAQVISAGDEAKAKALADQWRAGADWAAMEAAATAAGAAAIVQDNATEKEFPDPDLAKAVFGATVDTVSPPVKGALGWFVVKVTKAAAGGSTPFDEVKDKLRERVITEKALDVIYDRANKIDGLLANGASLETLPADLGLTLADVTLDQRGYGQNEIPVTLPGEDEIRTAVTTAAFEAQKGDPPHLTEVQTPSTGGSGYFALTVEDVVPAGEKPFDAVRDAVTGDWRADQRRHAAETAAAAMLKAVTDGKPFSDAAREAGVVPRLSPLVTRNTPDPAMPPEVQRGLFGLKNGEPTMVETGEGFLVATPVEIVAPDPAADPAGYRQLKTAVERSVATDLATVFAEALRERANPRINQANVDQLVQP